jgi:hypothetical protein
MTDLFPAVNDWAREKESNDEVGENNEDRQR